MGHEHIAEVIPLPLPGMEYVHGVAKPLGQLTVDELVQVVADCRERVREYQTELQIAEMYLETRYPEGGDA